MTKAHSGSNRGRKAKSRSSSQQKNTMIPTIPMPSPDLCLLNSRSPSCLYGVHHERGHSRRVHISSQNKGINKSSSRTESESDDGGTRDGTVMPDIDAIHADLRTYGSLLSYIAVRMANKRNALEILGIDMGSVSKGFGLLVRNSKHGVPFLPLETLVKTLLMRLASNGAKTPKTPVNLEGILGETSSLKKYLIELIGQVVEFSPLDKASKSKHSVRRAADDKATSRSFQNIAHLPLMDNTALSILMPSAVVIPEDPREVHSLFSNVNVSSPMRSTSGTGGEATELHSTTANKEVTTSLNERINIVDRSNREKRATARHERNRTQQRKHARLEASNPPAKSRPHNLSDPDKDCASAYTSDRIGYSGRQLGKGRRKDQRTAESVDFEESKMTVEQMVQNLMDGKLCDGSDPVEPKDFVISILVAGLYEYLPVEFFNELLQDERLSACFDNIPES